MSLRLGTTPDAPGGRIATARRPVAIVTRPRESAGSLVAALQARGVEPVLAPMLEVRRCPGATVDLDGTQAVLVTSSNGARAFAALSDARDRRMLAVGEATAATLRELGFARVESAGGDSAALARMVRARLDPGAGALLHAGARDLAGDLETPLAAAGFTYRRAILYETHPPTALPDPAIAALRRGAYVLLFSPRSARAFAALVKAAGLDETCGTAIALCISAAVAAAATGLAWTMVQAACRPTLPDLLDLLDEHLRARAPTAA